MTKRLFITILAGLILSVSAFGQDGTISAPETGDVQFDLILGSSTFFAYDAHIGYDYMLPDDRLGEIGFGTGDQSDKPLKYLNLGEMNSNNILNLVGLKTTVFLSKHFDLNLMFGMNINILPKKDFIEGDFSDPLLAIPDQQYVLGKTQQLFHSELGFNYHFIPENKRFTIYIGVAGGFNMARIDAMSPYTGNTEINGDPSELYNASYKVGQSWAIQGGIVGGINFSIVEGLVLGFEISPAMYQYSVLATDHASLAPYSICDHDIKILSMPRLKLGFRF